MKLAKVIGTVVATVKDPTLQGQKLLLIQPLDHLMEPEGEPVTAVDAAQAGPGDLVYWILKRESCYLLSEWFSPIDAGIAAVVDRVTVEDLGINGKNKIFGKEAQ